MAMLDEMQEFLVNAKVFPQNGEYIDGVWQEADATSYNIKMIAPQPVSGEKILDATYLENTTSILFTRTKNKLNTTKNDKTSDIIEYKNKRYRVIDCEEWQEPDASIHYKITMVLL